MYIEHKQYLCLLDEIDYLKKDNSLLRQQNHILRQQISNQQQKRIHLQQNHIKSMKLIQQLHAKAISYEIDQKRQIMQKMIQIQRQTKQYLQTKFTTLQNSSLTQVQSLQIQNAKTKLDYYQLVQFVNKLRLLYNITQGIDGSNGNNNNKNKNKKQPTLMLLLKWIKSIPGVAVNLTKSNGFHNSSMSLVMNYTTTSKMKKQTINKSRFKQNKFIINQSQSKLKITQ